MTLDEQTAMSPDEADALLTRHETGVLSLARDDEPYAIPISYGYDADARQFYFRLVSTPESEKDRFLSSEPRVRLVVYEEDGDTYRSIVAKGTLREIPRDELTTEHVEQYGDAKRPLFEIWGQEKTDLEITLYCLDPDQLDGRRIVVDRDSDSDSDSGSDPDSGSDSGSDPDSDSDPGSDSA